MTWLTKVLDRHPVLAWTGIANLTLTIAFLLMSQLDSRELSGINVWFKPAKFALSIGVFSLSLAWFWPLFKTRWIGSVTGWLLCGEMFLISLQAARGVPSHFNRESWFDDMIYSTMGVMIVVVSIIVAVLLVKLMRQLLPLRHGGSTYHLAVCVGLLLFLASAVVGGQMSLNNQHSVGVNDDSAGLFFLNWKQQGGDLRIAHFLGLHGLQVLPMTAARWKSRKVFVVSTLLYVGMFIRVLVSALNGNPPVPLQVH